MGSLVREWVGLIPAWAGKTLTSLERFSAMTAHPRVGGENVQGFVCAHCGGGSSPRGRGKRDEQEEKPSTGGLIPAWAGKTSNSRRAQSKPSAHPRVGGENPG